MSSCDGFYQTQNDLSSIFSIFIRKIFTIIFRFQQKLYAESARFTKFIFPLQFSCVYYISVFVKNNAVDRAAIFSYIRPSAAALPFRFLPAVISASPKRADAPCPLPVEFDHLRAIASG